MKRENNSNDLVNAGALIVCMTGADIVAPEAIVEPKLANFKEVKSTDDSIIDSSLILAEIESPIAKTELIELLVMRLLPLSSVMKLNSFLNNYIREMLEYTAKHPECRQKCSDEEIGQKLKKLLG